jgi:membrane protease YdiL (CAAX protease family)
LPILLTVNFGSLPLTNYLPFMLTAVFATVIYTWVYNNTGGSILLAILLHATSNAASQWLGAILSESGLQPPQEGVAGFLATTS